MSYKLELDEDQYKKLENYHRKTRDPKLRDFLDKILKENNDVVDGDIIYNEICNHDKIDINEESLNIEFEKSLNYQGQTARYVCRNCWVVWDYFHSSTIGKIEEEKERERILEEV